MKHRVAIPVVGRAIEDKRRRAANKRLHDKYFGHMTREDWMKVVEEAERQREELKARGFSGVSDDDD
jgi:hypothetical protein